MDDFEKYEQIESYLDQTMPSAERSAFEKELAKNPDLQRSIDLHQQLAETLQGDQVHQLRNTLNQVDQDWSTTPTKDTPILSLPFRKVLAVAASLLVLILVYQALMPSTSTPPATLFAENFTPYKMVLNERSAQTEASATPNLAEAITAYEQKDFTKAAQIFQTLSPPTTEKIAFLFYQAQAEIALGNASTAIPLLEKIVATKDHLFVEQSRWYLGLAYLQDGQSSAAQEVLAGIEEGAYGYEEAWEILGVLGE